MDNLVFRNTKELFDYVRSYDIVELSEINKKKDENSFKKTDINDLVRQIESNERLLLIDVRSEKEYEESSIPKSVNFSILKTSERHNVGLVYANYESSAAFKLAEEYALQKVDSLRTFLHKTKADTKDIYVYCWRGGGRSRYLSKLLKEEGLSTTILAGGFKEYRRLTVNFFSRPIFLHNLLELSGKTGCGKTELINEISDLLPVIDLEKAARHYSSLFGFIPYQIKGYIPIKNQSAFENDIFGQIILSKKLNNTDTTFIIESESKKVGDFFIPEILFDKMTEALSVKIESSLENRVKRIVKDYFGSTLEGLEPMMDLFIKKNKYFKKELGTKTYNSLTEFLGQGKINEFTEIMLLKFYDLKYKQKQKNPIAIINTDDLAKAKINLTELYKENFINQKNN
ncbi:MAG: tRNA 2-selenouridine(34) synthase MnmH [Ignavibacteria bacterium]|nr:tRNA 2-selenouridine(34) synthase MnmH [Ignavibacteria bacterium]